MPFEDADRLVALFRNRPAQGVQFMGVSIHDFEDWRAQQTSFEDIAAYYAETVNIGGTEGTPIRYLGAYVNARMFDLLRVQPVLGRLFRPEEDHPSTPPVMLLSYRAWQDRFQGDPAIVGAVVRANAELTTIVGVMPEKFGFPQQMDAWLPLRIDPAGLQPRRRTGRGRHAAAGRGQAQAPGSRSRRAQAEMSTIATGLAAAYPASNQGIGVTVQPLMETFIGPQAAAMLYTMLGAVFGVLLIACANVANLLLARTVARSKEIAIRTALGASRRRTILQLLAETLVLALAGAAVGLVVAKVGIDFFNAGLATQDTPLWLVATLDPVGDGLRRRPSRACRRCWPAPFPALRATRTDVAGIMNDEARGSSSGRMGKVSRALVDRPARRVVRPAGGGRPDDPHRRQRGAVRLRVCHRPTSSPRVWVCSPRTTPRRPPSGSSTTRSCRDWTAGPACAPSRSPPTCRREAGNGSPSPSTASPIPPSRITRWPTASSSRRAISTSSTSRRCAAACSSAPTAPTRNRWRS